jgi:predicted MFS family arabinose efflux permease
MAARVAAGGAAPAWWITGIRFTAITMTVTGVASFLSSSWWGRLHDGRVPFLTPAGAALLAASTLLLVAWPAWWVVLLARAGVGAGSGATSTLQFAVIAGRMVPEERAVYAVVMATALRRELQTPHAPSESTGGCQCPPVSPVPGSGW